MATFFSDLDKRCCITCQHFRCNRTIVNQSGRILIRYNTPTGECALAYETSNQREIYRPAGNSTDCSYSRWLELP